MKQPARYARLRTSTRLHFVLLRFSMISLSSSILDNLVFYAVFHATGTILGAQGVAKTASVLFNYYFVRRSVFFSGGGHQIQFPRYVLLAGLNALLSYAGIRILAAATPLGVMRSKILVETFLFGFNFLMQRAWIFRHGGSLSAEL
ncbi:MAG TPA: GtrA family protein [Bryobacteraceae bacterium]|jgi:putative flippase GtrA|nr:GtrA family protein [Bryobacteraceae bacterium]